MTGWLRAVFRLVVGAVLAAGGVAVWLERESYRGGEAAVAGWSSALATGSQELVRPERATYFVNVGRPDVFAVIVTPECSSAIVTALVLGLSFLALAVRRLAVGRVLAAAGAATTLFMLANILRLTLITYSSDRWGLEDGYRFSHTWAGTAITTFGGACTVVVFLLVLSSRSAVRRSLPTRQP